MTDFIIGKYGERVEVVANRQTEQEGQVCLVMHYLNRHKRLVGVRARISSDLARKIAAELLKAADELETEE